MAGTCVHLAVATELNTIFRQSGEKYLGKHWESYQAEFFFAGNICPDGIMARKDYQREMKLHTHLRDGIPDGSFQERENLALFRERLMDFFRGNVYGQGRNFSLYLGYLTHMLTDEKFILELHGRVLESLAEVGYDRNNPETFALFGKDVDQIDFRLVAEYPGMEEAYRCLSRVSPYEIADMITTDELNDSRHWILSYFFEREHSLAEPKFLKYDTMKHFIPEAVKEILQRLPDYFE